MGAAAPLLISQGAQAASTMGTAYVQARAARAQGRFEKRSAGMNARLAELQAEDAIRRGDVDVAALTRQSNQLMGAQRAAMGASGAQIGFGSARDIALESQTMSAMDALTLRNNAYREAFGYKISANEARARGKFAGIAGRNQSRQTLLAGGMSALSQMSAGLNQASKY